MLERLTIRTRLTLLAVLFAVGMGAYGAFALMTVDEVKVNGPHYGRIVRSKDLLADVLPPPAYLVESRLVILEMADAARAGDRARYHALGERFTQLREEYAGSYAKWEKALDAGPVKETLLGEARVAGQEFLDIADRQFFPAVSAGDNERAVEVVRGPLAVAYNRHRAAIDKVVELEAKEAARIETSVAGILRLRSLLLIGGALLVLVVIGAITMVIARSVTVPLGEAVSLAGRLAEGDLGVRVPVRGSDELAALARSLNQAVESMGQVLRGIRSSSDAVASASTQLSAASGAISSGAQEQASSLEETAASLEEITGTVKQNAENAQQAAQLAQGAREVAEKGGAVVGHAVTAMSEINGSSKKIEEIITAIDEIAFQTNLLALNAAVEAARAGEQGRGFAVVAGEVRNLAQRSASAAKEIKGLIQDSVRKVESGSELVNQSGRTLEEIVTSVKRVTDIISKIASASREQATGIDQVGRAVSQMDQVTQANAAQTEELAGTAESLSSQAGELQRMVGRFELGDLAGSSPRPSPGRVTPITSHAAARLAPVAAATGTDGDALGS